MRHTLTLFAAMLFITAGSLFPAKAQHGVPVTYRLPTTGPLPQTYRVTLAVVDEKKPSWIISQFAAGVVRTVTAENGGKFSETWDGLDDNFMPVPPGTYGLKGIYMPAAKWPVDGEHHSITPRYVTTADAWRALPGESKTPIVVGDPVNSPIGDVDVGPNGVGVFCYQYLENARNFYEADFKKPINYDQATPGYGSGGAAGGKAVATDGITSWCSETEGFVFRTDGKKFGNEDGRYRKGVHQSEGYVTAMAAFRDEGAGKSFVYLAERGRLIRDDKRWHRPEESTNEMVNQILVLDGDTAARVASVPVAEPLGVVARWGDRLWVLHKDGEGFAVSAAAMKAGLPEPALKRVFKVPAGITPGDLEVDSRARIYIADAKANKVLQFTSSGKLLRTFGKLGTQRSGSYDPESFMSPEKLSCWRDAEGHDRLIVVERQGMDRVSEWSADDGNLLREWLSAQTFANAGYAVDPRHPEQFYIQGHGGWLIRFHVDYETGAWRAGAVWPDVCTGRFEHQNFGFPRMIYRGDTRYLAWSRGNFIYRESGDRWLASAAILTEGEGKDRKRYLWHDENGDGKVQDSEYLPHLTTPPMNSRYWGDSWLDDLSLVAIQEGSADVWRLAPESFDAHGNPIYSANGWKKLLTDPVLDARKQGTATAVFGGNEIGDHFSSAWAMVAGSMKDGFYVNARGPDISANFGAQQKLSRYVPDGKGGYELAWRVGRAALRGTAGEGEVYGSIHVMAPIGGIVTQVDQSRSGMVLHTEDGLYVDTLFPDERKTGGKTAGSYNLPGEFFTGYSFANADNGKVFLALGKTTPMLFEAEGWTAKGNPTHRLETVQKTVTITASQIAAAPEFALAVRKQRSGGTTARVAQFAPMPGGGPALDGSMSGWEVCEPATFAADAKQTVEVRCGFDPAHLYLRWHVRLGRKFDAKPLEPADRLFTHDREADTMSFYIQGDTNAIPAKNGNGRAGDARFVFGLFADKGEVRPVALAMLPKWFGAGKPSPLIYQTPAGGAAVFEHVGLLATAKLGHALDADGEGFVIAASIPRASVPMLPAFEKELRTQVNFDATFGGHNRVWWANADGSATRETYDEPTEARLYPGSWAQAQFQGLDNGALVQNWLVCGPFGGPGAEKFKADPDGVIAGTTKEMKKAVQEFCDAATYPPDDGKVDMNAIYKGDIIRGYWPDPREVRWQKLSTAPFDNRFIAGFGGQMWYASTWIHSPAETELEFRFQASPMAVSRWSLNGTQLALEPGDFTNTKQEKHLEAIRTLKLRAGWNQIFVRSYCFGYAPHRVGLVLNGTAEKLWPLKLSSTNP